MASLTMIASLLSTPSPSASQPPNRGTLPVSKPAAPPQLSGSLRRKEETEGDGRRGLIFAAAAAAVAAAAGRFPAMAEEEKGSSGRKLRKLYAPVCVTMPTASVCHK